MAVNSLIVDGHRSAVEVLHLRYTDSPTGGGCAVLVGRVGVGYPPTL